MRLVCGTKVLRSVCVCVCVCVCVYGQTPHLAAAWSVFVGQVILANSGANLTHREKLRRESLRSHAASGTGTGTSASTSVPRYARSTESSKSMMKVSRYVRRHVPYDMICGGGVGLLACLFVERHRCGGGGALS